MTTLLMIFGVLLVIAERHMGFRGVAADKAQDEAPPGDTERLLDLGED